MTLEKKENSEFDGRTINNILTLIDEDYHYQMAQIGRLKKLKNLTLPKVGEFFLLKDLKRNIYFIFKPGPYGSFRLKMRNESGNLKSFLINIKGTDWYDWHEVDFSDGYLMEFLESARDYYQSLQNKERMAEDRVFEEQRLEISEQVHQSGVLDESLFADISEGKEVRKINWLERIKNIFRKK